MDSTRYPRLTARGIPIIKGSNGRATTLFVDPTKMKKHLTEREWKLWEDWSWGRARTQLGMYASDVEFFVERFLSSLPGEE